MFRVCHCESRLLSVVKPWASLLVLALFCSPVVGETTSSKTYQFARRPKETMAVHVKLALRAQGQLLSEGQGAGSTPIPLTVNAESEYLERQFAASDASGHHAVRAYRLAKASVTVGDIAEQTELPADRRIVRLLRGPQSKDAWCLPQGHLTRSQLDLLRVPYHSAVIGGFLPDTAVRVNDMWAPAAQDIANVLGLDEANDVTVRGKLTEIQKGLAMIQVGGRVLGRVDGALTEIELTGQIRYDLKMQCVRWAQVKFREDRGASAVGPSMRSVAEVRMLIEPKGGNEAPPPFATPDWESTLVHYRSEAAGLEFLADPRWTLVTEDSKQVVMRLMEGRGAAAQCNLTRLAPLPAGKELTLEAFQNDIRKALENRFESFASAREAARADGTRILRVAVDGVTDGSPSRWLYLHITQTDGQRASIMIATARDGRERIAGQDEQLVRSLRVFEPTVKDAKSTAPSTPSAPSPEAKSAPLATPPRRSVTR